MPKVKRIAELRAEYREMVESSRHETIHDKVKAKLTIADKLDPSFAGKFESERFADCMEYVMESAYDALGNENGDVPDEVIYRMARDFYTERLWEDGNEPVAKDVKPTRKKEGAVQTSLF